MLTITNLTAEYTKGVPVVRGVDLHVGPGEVVALVGESGSGKSTIAKVLLGMLPDGASATGSARFGDTELVGRREADWRGVRGRRIGVIPQGGMSGLNPVYRIETQLAEAVRLHTASSGPAASARAAELLARVHLDSAVLRAYPHQLSGGMRQRVAIALAMAGEPELIVADEPTTGLDLITQERILELLKELCADRTIAMLLISHDLPGLLGLSDRIAVMYAGKIVEVGPADDVRCAASHPYTEGLLRASASVLPGTKWAAIPGAAPAPDAALNGCRFAPRCPIAAPECVEHEPDLVAHGKGDVACHRAGEPVAVEFPAVPDPNGAGDETKPVARIAGLVVRFRGRRRSAYALRGVDVAVGRGEILGLVGESGSGKTTLGRVLLGLIRPTAGRAWVDGVDLSTLRGRRLRTAQRRVGFVHQDPYAALHPAMSVRALVAEPLALAGVPRPERLDRIVNALTDAGLPTDDDFLARLPARLSGGQRQRVAIARALVGDPILLIADEATSMLDVSTRAGIVSTLRRLSTEHGLSVLFITHDLGEAMHGCDRVVVLRGGTVVESGRPVELVERPAAAYTAELVDAGRRRAID